MQTSTKVFTQAISIDNEVSTLTLKINKKKLANSIRTLALIVLFLSLGISLLTTYKSENNLFWPLLQSTTIISLIAFIASKSSNNIKN